MRGKKARQIRREVRPLPADIAEEAHTLIVAAADIRRSKTDRAARLYNEAEYAARQRRNADTAKAEHDFRLTKSAILEEARAEADRRTVGVAA